MLRKISAVLALCALLVPAWAAAEVQTFKLDPVHSEVAFTIRHLVSKVTGRFDQFEGVILLDPKDPSTMSITGKVQAGSIDTNSEKRDADLKSPNFFDVANNPEITFTSKKVTKNGDKWTVVGDLTMHGVTKEVALDLSILGFMEAMGGTRVGMEATGKLNRKDYGINWNKTFDNGGTLLSDEVDITLRAEAGLAQAGATAPAKK